MLMDRYQPNRVLDFKMTSLGYSIHSWILLSTIAMTEQAPYLVDRYYLNSIVTSPGQNAKYFVTAQVNEKKLSILGICGGFAPTNT